MCLMILKTLKIKNKNKVVLNAGFTKNNFSKQTIVEKIKKNIKNCKIEYVDAIVDEGIIE